MKAAVVKRYGAPDVVRLVELPVPEPRAGQVRVRVAVTAVTAGDARIRGARFPKGFGPLARLMFGVRGPRRKVLGNVFSGTVDAVGAGVTDLSPGDEVCGMTGPGMGAHAEYVVVAAAQAVPKPAGVSHEDAAGVLFGGTTALFFLRDEATLKPGASVLVNGASGAVGTNAVQLAGHFGARVTGVASTPNLDLVTELGAEHTVDYTSTGLASLTDRFDVVLDTVGNLSPASGRRLLNDGGVLLLAAAGLWELITARGNVRAGAAPERPEDFAFLLELVAEGALTSVTDRIVPIEEIVAAYRRVDSGRKVGNVLVRP
ncbi:NAD(P)-dependent alcohol dehydrogenase [Nocardiopsis metallicus]|uniref:NADPH:quinone reductase-like Zn-dependent oxidoreductase n=1 Tax=Nocardiopsis metallicus TaxID=179819 RepID=A0A840WCE2_9ACTN|nr:NAD(P)-dependent alcohol dehydrogenase [Nocardiopsis metallicus]MBB5489407.1 NADPH:quinone reductase-like Zn-dependent oxidoreductase [Nocardiopsis metallicus]